MNQGYGSAPLERQGAREFPQGEQGSYPAGSPQGGGYFPGDRGKSDAPDMSLKLLMEVAVGAWAAFAAVCMLFGFSYHDSETEVWSLVLLGAFVLAIVVGTQWRQRNYNPQAHASVIIAGWLLASILMGTLVGLFSYDCCIGEYWLSQSLQARQNVLPSEPAGAYAATGEIVFADEARVDASKSVGFKDSQTYCVAPVASDAPLDTVQFWAAGIDCCGARGSFACDDAWNPKAHAGVVINNQSNVLLRSDIRGKYLKAVKLAEVTYGIASAQEPIFVRWVANPDQVQVNIWRAGFGILLASIIIAALFCVLQAYVISLILNKNRGHDRQTGIG